MFNASHLEVKKFFTEDFETQPYEAGWASEVIFFIMVEQMSGDDPCLTARVQISHDGVNWCDEGTVSGPVDKEGLHFVRVRHFGNYLRLACHITGTNPSFKLNIQIACKE
jgi:hypothetical protein